MKLRNQSCQLILGHYTSENFQALGEKFQTLGKNPLRKEKKFQALGTNRDGDG